MNFQLYRGNLHKVPDVPRRWPLGKPSISLRVFKKAITKRQEALLGKDKSGGDEQSCGAHAAEDLQTGSKDDSENENEQARKRKRESSQTCVMDIEGEEHLHCVSERKARVCAEVELGTAEDASLNRQDDVACDTLRAAQSEDEPAKDGGECADIRSDDRQATVAPDYPSEEKDGERLEAPRTPAAKNEDCTKSMERTQTMDLDTTTPRKEALSLATRRAELQEQLKQLQETKHQLVQILKQVLIAEESKRKNQGLSQYPAPNGTTGTAETALEQDLGSDKQPADLEEGELDLTRSSGPAVAGSACGIQFSEVQIPANAPVIHCTKQQLTKP